MRLANDAVDGLASSVYTPDTAMSEAIARRIRAGNPVVNEDMKRDAERSPS